MGGPASFRIGNSLGVYDPTATFHIINELSENSTLKLECKIENSIIGSIRHLFIDGGNQYGIYQTGLDFQNYFEGDVTCNSFLNFTGHGSGISISNQDQGFSFHYSITPPGPPVSIPLIIKYNGVKVQDLMECNDFLLHHNAGDGKVLMSDNIGNGIWSDASRLNDNDWLVDYIIGNKTNLMNLYLNPDYLNVGIGVIPNGSYSAKLSVLNTDNSVGSLINSFRNNITTNNFGLYVISGQNGRTPLFFERDPGIVNTGLCSSLANNNPFDGSMKGIVANVVNNSQCSGTIVGIQSYVSGQSEDINTYGIYSSVNSSGDPNIRWSGFFSGGDLQLDYGRLIVGAVGYRNFLIFTDYLNENGSHNLLICPQNGNGSASLENRVSLTDNGDFVVQKKLEANDMQVNNLLESTDIQVDHRLLVGTSNFPADPGGTGKLAVDGKIYAREIEINIETWPDYVLNANYNLMSLKEVENFILTNKHLPDVPSESEIKSSGANLGELNAILIKKVEELTLYIIGQQKQIDSLKMILKIGSN